MTCCRLRPVTRVLKTCQADNREIVCQTLCRNMIFIDHLIHWRRRRRSQPPSTLIKTQLTTIRGHSLLLPRAFFLGLYYIISLMECFTILCLCPLLLYLRSSSSTSICTVHSCKRDKQNENKVSFQEVDGWIKT